MKPIARRRPISKLTEAQARHAEAVCRQVIGRFGTFQQADQDDLVQEVLMSLVQDSPIRDGDVGYRTIGCLRRAMRERRYADNKDELRRLAEQDRMLLEATTNAADEVVEEAEHVIELKRALQQAIGRAHLTPTEFKYLSAYLGGERPTDTAKRVGVTVQAISFSFRRALTKLARFVEWP